MQGNRLELWLGHMPKDRWDEILGEVRTKVEDLKGLYEDIMSGL
jgi:hypothetical protein